MYLPGTSNFPLHLHWSPQLCLDGVSLPSTRAHWPNPRPPASAVSTLVLCDLAEAFWWFLLPACTLRCIGISGTFHTHSIIGNSCTLSGHFTWVWICIVSIVVSCLSASPKKKPSTGHHMSQAFRLSAPVPIRCHMEQLTPTHSMALSLKMKIPGYLGPSLVLDDPLECWRSVCWTIYLTHGKRVSLQTSIFINDASYPCPVCSPIPWIPSLACSLMFLLKLSPTVLSLLPVSHSSFSRHHRKCLGWATRSQLLCLGHCYLYQG